MNLKLASVQEPMLHQIVADIEMRGYAELPNYIDLEMLRRMKDFVASAVHGSHGEYTVFNGPSAVTGSGLDEIPDDPAFKDLIGRIYKKFSGHTLPVDGCYQVLRCLIGQTARKHSYHFHYDSYVVTVLIPIEIPESGQSGDLLMLPNTRLVRKSYARNVFDKLLLDNPVTQALLRLLLKWRGVAFTRIKMVPGNAYIFWGYRSIHTNEPCDPDKVRATALFHYFNPHAKTA